MCDNIVEVSSDEDFGIGCEVSVEDTSFSFDIDWDEGVSENEGEIDLFASQGNLDEVLLEIEIPTGIDTELDDINIVEGDNSCRFAHFSDEAELERRAKDRVPKKTLKNNRWSAKAWESWATWRNEQPLEIDQPYDVVPIDVRKCSCQAELGHWLARFVLEVRRKDGKEYPFRTLYDLCTGLQRVLRETNEMCDVHIFEEKDINFKKFVGALDSKIKELQRRGIGTVTKSADPITVEDENQLWERGVISRETGQGLLYGIFFYNSKLFGLRASTGGACLYGT